MRPMGRRGMVASPNYLATATGVAVLRRGGSAVDAAIATNAVLAVVLPYLCGIGGDLFAIVYDAASGEMHGLNGSGRAPAEAKLDRVRELAGGARIPARGPLAVTVPGCVEAWEALHGRFGRLPMSDILSDAVGYARDGFPVTAAFARAMAASAPFLHPDTPATETYLPGGRPPKEGQILTLPRLTATLEAIAADGAQAFYRGNVAKEIVRSHRAIGGLLAEDDLARHHSDWVEPLSATYRDVTVFELPPNSQGVVALMMLAMLDRMPPESLASDGEEWIHRLAEVARLAYADREQYLTDPEAMTIDLQRVLSSDYVDDRVKAVGERVAPRVVAGVPGDTIYLATADRDGNLVSMIESNFMGIGSGVMAGETGVMLQNRGSWFSLDPDHVNVIAPRKRTMHTLMPAMAWRDNRPWLVFGTMGGSAQPQIQVEVLTRVIDQGVPLDEAIAAPRFDAVVGADESGGPALHLEGRFSPEVLEGLRRRGHGVVTADPYSSSFGHAHAIQLLANGVYVGAADPRADSLALGY